MAHHDGRACADQSQPSVAGAGSRRGARAPTLAECRQLPGAHVRDHDGGERLRLHRDQVKPVHGGVDRRRWCLYRFCARFESTSIDTCSRRSHRSGSGFAVFSEYLEKSDA